MEAVIELRRSKNLGLGVFVVVEVAVYLAEKFAGDLRDQNIAKRRQKTLWWP